MFWIIILFAVTVVAENDSMIEDLTCLSDRDCPATSFCETSMCIKCLDCSKRNRRDGYKQCIRQYEECGSCLEGFYDDSFSGRLRCSPNQIIAEAQQNKDLTIPAVNPAWFGLVVVCFIISVSLMSFYCYRKRTISLAVNTHDHESGICEGSQPPPPYREDYSQMNAYSFQLRISEPSAGHKTTAVPFQMPYYEGNTIAYNTPNNESNENSIVNSNEENESSGIDEYDSPNLDIHDETTTASHWTPGPSYSANEQPDQEKVSPPPKKRKTEIDATTAES